MAIRSYRKPIVIPAFHPDNPEEDCFAPQETHFMEVYVVNEDPLLEFGHADLVFLKQSGIDPFGK